MSALMAIIANRGGVASGKIYNIGNPANDFSVRELATMMLDLAREYPEYRDNARAVTLVEITAAAYYGEGYQDVQNARAEDRQHDARPRLGTRGGDG